MSIILLDNWQGIALLAGPYGGLALLPICSRSLKGLVAAGARMHNVCGYIGPRMKRVWYDAVAASWNSRMTQALEISARTSV